MDKIFINFSNHPSNKWDQAETDAAKEYGSVIDIPFPMVDPDLDENEIDKLSDEYARIITGYSPKAVMCQGEFTLCFSIVCKLKKQGIKVLSACSERNVVELGSKKTSIFQFVQFREYQDKGDYIV